MKLEQAVELLQGYKFHIRGEFLTTFGEDVSIKYVSKATYYEHKLEPVDVKFTLIVIDAKILINDIGINLDKITTKVELLNEVNNGLFNIIDADSDGVERI